MVRKLDEKICTKCVRVLINEHLLFKDHINTLKQKLNKANGRKNDVLSKLIHYFPSVILSCDVFNLLYRNEATEITKQVSVL